MSCMPLCVCFLDEIRHCPPPGILALEVGNMSTTSHPRFELFTRS